MRHVVPRLGIHQRGRAAKSQYMELFDGTDDCRERDTTTKHTKLSSFTNEDQVG